MLSSTGAGRQQAHYPEACQRAHSPTGFPPCHGPGSRPGPCQAHSAQGEEGLSVLCLCLSGDCQAVGCCPPHHCPHPHSDTLADTPAGTHYRGECLGKAVRSQPRPGPGCGRWHLRAPYAPCQNWLKEFGEKHREALSPYPVSAQRLGCCAHSTCVSSGRPPVPGHSGRQVWDLSRQLVWDGASWITWALVSHRLCSWDSERWLVCRCHCLLSVSVFWEKN